MAVEPTTDALLAHVERHLPAGTIRLGTPSDAIDGVCPRIVAEPTTRKTLSQVLEWAGTERLAVSIRGGGTKLTWGRSPAPIDLALSTARLNQVVEHRHGDLTATVEAGVTLTQVNATLGVHRQWLPLDPPWPDRATVGGIVATNDSGPRRHWHGAPRDLIIGVTVARPDGALAKAGGIVVKNVAGYDLSRLMTGAFGSLGVIVDATFKVTPVAASSRTLTVDLDTVEALEPALAAVMASSLTPFRGRDRLSAHAPARQVRVDRSGGREAGRGGETSHRGCHQRPCGRGVRFGGARGLGRTRQPMGGGWHTSKGEHSSPGARADAELAL